MQAFERSGRNNATWTGAIFAVLAAWLLLGLAVRLRPGPAVPREWGVLELMAVGRSNSVIAHRLFITEKAVASTNPGNGDA